VVFITLVSKLVQLLFETDHHLMLENDVEAHNFKIVHGTIKVQHVNAVYK